MIAEAGWKFTREGTRPKCAIPTFGIDAKMGINTSFSLDDHLTAFINDEVASGRYGSASDVVRAALRLLQGSGHASGSAASSARRYG